METHAKMTYVNLENTHRLSKVNQIKWDKRKRNIYLEERQRIINWPSHSWVYLCSWTRRSSCYSVHVNPLKSSIKLCDLYSQEIDLLKVCIQKVFSILLMLNEVKISNKILLFHALYIKQHTFTISYLNN